MTRPIYAQPLLTTAHMLAGGSAGAGRPPLSNLRRATSTAYYAVFHQITRHGAFNFLPSSDEEEVASISRWFTHTGVLKACNLITTADNGRSLDQITRSDRSAVSALRASCEGGDLPTKLILLADSFATLQNARHAADYDSTYDPVRAVTLGHVELAQRACESAWWLWRSRDLSQPSRTLAWQSYSCFLSLAAMTSGGPRTRE